MLSLSLSIHIIFNYSSICSYFYGGVSVIFRVIDFLVLSDEYLSEILNSLIFIYPLNLPKVKSLTIVLLLRVDLLAQIHLTLAVNQFIFHVLEPLFISVLLLSLFIAPLSSDADSKPHFHVSALLIWKFWIGSQFMTFHSDHLGLNFYCWRISSIHKAQALSF